MPLAVRRIKLAAMDGKEKTGNNLFNINKFYELFKNSFKDTISVCACFF
jgi:hypothetical protein